MKFATEHQIALKCRAEERDATDEEIKNLKGTREVVAILVSIVASAITTIVISILLVLLFHR